MAEISNVNVPLTGLRSTPNAEDGVQQGSTLQGAFRGEGLTARVGSLSLFQAAQEELGFSVAERASADISRRQAKDAARVNEVLKLIEEYLKQVNDLERKDLHNFATNLGQQNITNMRQLLVYMQQQFEDISHQYVALLYAREFLKKQGRRRLRKGKKGLDNLLALVEDAIVQYDEDDGAAISAGLNVTGVASTYSEQTGLGSVQQLRDLYRDSILDYAGLSDTYRQIVAKYGTSDLPKAIEFLLQGLAADLGVQGSSIEPERLQLIIADMYRLRVVNSVYAEAVAMLVTVRDY